MKTNTTFSKTAHARLCILQNFNKGLELISKIFVLRGKGHLMITVDDASIQDGKSQ